MNICILRLITASFNIYTFCSETPHFPLLSSRAVDDRISIFHFVKIGNKDASVKVEAVACESDVMCLITGLQALQPSRKPS